MYNVDPMISILHLNLGTSITL